MHDERVLSIGRRQFLGNAAKVGALAAFPGLLASCGEDEPAATIAPTSTTGLTATTGPSPQTSAAAAPLRLGLLVPLSGNLGAIGPELQLGFEIYLEQQGGSLGGRPVEVVVEDSEGVPEVGVRKAQRLLLEESVDVVTGILSSAVGLVS